MIANKNTAESMGFRFIDSCNAAALRTLLGLILIEGHEKVLHLQNAADMGVDFILEADNGRIALRCDKGGATATVPVGAVRDFLGAVCNMRAARGYFFTTSQFEEAARELASENPQLELIDRTRFAELIEVLTKEFSGRSWLSSRAGRTSLGSNRAAPLIELFDAVLAFDGKIESLERAGNIPGIKDYLYQFLPHIRNLIHTACRDEPLATQVLGSIASERIHLESLKKEIERLTASAPDCDRSEYLELCERFFEAWEAIQSPPPLMPPRPTRSLEELRMKLLATRYRKRRHIPYK